VSRHGRRPASRTLGDLIDEMTAATPTADAVVSAGERLDYRALRERIDALARGMLASGIARGDRVALLCPNRTAWIVVAFAAAKVGAIIVAISTFSTPRELAWTLRHSGAAALFTVGEFRGRRFIEALRTLCPELERCAAGDLRSRELPALRTIVALDGPASSGIFDLPAFASRGALIELAALQQAQGAVSPGDVAYILYTSGSTAAPKGVPLAHGPLIANGFDIGERQHLRATDRLWLAVPLFWSFGSANALPAILTHGGCVVLQESFEPGEAIALIERERCSVYYGMANMARALLDHSAHPGRRLGAMRTGLTIGPPEDLQLTIRATGAEKLCNVYGSTETYGNCAVTDADEPPELRLATQGLPLPGMQIRAVDPQSRRVLARGETGELAVRGYITPGYFQAPELDAQAFDADGWFLTGDLGFVDAEGRVRFRGRLKEMIKTGGINVAPLEVEHVLMGHAAVVQAHVVGVPDEIKGEIVAAAVELSSAASADISTLQAYCRERLASFKVPVRMVLWNAADFPRTSTGKINKPEIRRVLATSSLPPRET
jgi:fatty-acyl-CoA synthase